jgi:NAD(P)-dependent dehydrogenase (short-subunit alcohol dehydrogenase family)
MNDQRRSTRVQVAVITGASRGIGQALAARFARADVAVGLIARSAGGLAQTIAAVHDAGGTGEVFAADVTDHEAVRDAIEQIAASLGPIDVLVNNAGVAGPMGELWNVRPEEWWQTIEINLRGTYVCSREVLPAMVQRHRGRIVNVVSRAGAHRWPYFSPYAVSKAAVIKLTEGLAAETRELGVSVIAVHPGLVRAGLTDAGLLEGPPPPADSIPGRVRSWFEREISEGRSVSLEQAADFLFEVSSGRADDLSGRYIAIEDDLEELTQHAEVVRRENLHALKVQQLGSAGS